MLELEPDFLYTEPEKDYQKPKTKKKKKANKIVQELKYLFYV